MKTLAKTMLMLICLTITTAYAQDKVQSLVVTPSSATIVAGQTFQFHAFAVSSNGTLTDVTNSTEWYVANPPNMTVAVDDGAPGLVLGVSIGQAQMTATFRSQQGKRDYFFYANALINVQ